MFKFNKLGLNFNSHGWTDDAEVRDMHIMSTERQNRWHNHSNTVKHIETV